MQYKVAISGASGFLGKNLIKKLIEFKDYEIIPIPREYLYNPSDLKKLFKDYQPDCIYHFAAFGNQGKSGGQTSEEEMVLANIGATFNMLKASIEIPYKAFINIGSSSEYGDKSRAMSEYDLPETETFYGATKVGATYLARAFAKVYDKPIVNVRPFSVYGEYEADFRFIPTVIRSLLNDTEFTLEEDATHDWIYIKDFIKGLLIVTENAEKLKGKWINIGTGKFYTNKLVVEIIENFLSRKAKYRKAEGLRPGHSFFWQADINKLSTLGFKQSYDIADGLQETIKFYKKKI